MKAFLDYICKISNEEPFRINKHLGLNLRRISIHHNGTFITTLEPHRNYTYNKLNSKEKLIGTACSFFSGTIFEKKLNKWRFL